MTHPKLQEILGKLQKHLKFVYKNRLVSLVLFGSQARKEANGNSDIDVLIVVAGPLDVPYESERLNDFIADLCLEYDVLLSCLWTESQEWKTRQSPLLINIHREGIAV
ncbi:MAG: nucleotidyltransferase domain-containing protein [Phormidesmis sp.]